MVNQVKSKGVVTTEICTFAYRWVEHDTLQTAMLHVEGHKPN